MEPSVFIVLHEGKFLGPVLREDVVSFTSTLPGVFEIAPLTVPRPSDEPIGPMQLQLVATGDHRVFVDSFKVDTTHVLAGILQAIHFARRDERVLTAQELLSVQSDLFGVAQAIHSLMQISGGLEQQDRKQLIGRFDIP